MLGGLDQLRVGWSITARLNANVRATIAAIDEEAWAAIDYPEGGEAQVAETVLEMTNPKETVTAAQGSPRSTPHPPNRIPRRVLAQLAAPRVRHQPRRVSDRHHQPHTRENDTDTDTDSSRRLVEADRVPTAATRCVNFAIRDLKGSRRSSPSTIRYLSP
ncbi:MAG: hypothetical protein OXF41_19330 [bacterium]|nr:hypothetical protein [bacterium]